jgi:plastocyanin
VFAGTGSDDQNLHVDPPAILAVAGGTLPRMRKTILIAFVLGLSTFGAAPIALAQSATPINMNDDTFARTSVQITAGQTVTWMNSSTMVHTVTADDGSFDSGDVAVGAPFSYEFDTPGTYAYYCQYHGDVGGVGMSGVIVVQ